MRNIHVYVNNNDHSLFLEMIKYVNESETIITKNLIIVSLYLVLK
ncbi:hypothetical protein [Enterococcus villorum]